MGRDRLAVRADLRVALRETRSRKEVGWVSYALSQTFTAQLEDWKTTFAPVLFAIMEDVGAGASARFGLQFDVEHLWASGWLSGWLADYTLKFAQQPMDTTRDHVTRVIQNGLGLGWSGQRIEREIDAMFDVWLGEDAHPDREWILERKPWYRLEMIARTETMRAANAGTNELYKATGVTKHEWLTAIDGRERPEHAAANGQVVEVGKPFLVGGEELLFPGDPNGSPENTINCRCSTLPVVSVEDIAALPAPGIPIPPDIFIAGEARSALTAASEMRASPPNLQAREVRANITAFVPEEKAFLRRVYDEGPATTEAELKGEISSQLSRRLMGIPEWAKESVVLEEFLGSSYAEWRPGGTASENVIGSLVHVWAETSANADMRALCIQETARRLFGLEEFPYYPEGLMPMVREWLDKDPVLSSGLQHFLLAMYENTQEELQAAGIDRLVLWRGMNIVPPRGWATIGRTAGEVDDVMLQPISSFSASYDTAEMFSGHVRKPGRPTMMLVEVPRERIIGTAVSGFGCFGESEFVVIGGPTSAYMRQDDDFPLIGTTKEWIAPFV